MRLALVVGLVALWSGLWSGVAYAQLDSTRETGSHIYTEPRQADDPALVARYSKAVARCTYQRMGDEAIGRFLAASDPKTIDAERGDVPMRRVIRATEGCMNARYEDYNADMRSARLMMSVSSPRMRALLMEEAYLDHHGRALEIAPEAGELTRRTFVSTGDNLASAQGVARYADCVVYRQSRAADQLLRTEPGSADEAAKAQALAPVLGECLIDGPTIEFTPGSIRALVADGLWARATYGSQATN